ncbi:putative 3-oxoacyl-ACP reductase [Sulfobacillus acidophilus TPY]|uniref:3-oxoacyl-(Acyl-carrier-protein) reductase n=1 Tax=Sulfobacillus acidophilus (strain ATCC 700253 / DSM 10332 / NAL) TaxID=679936 RepID=G8TSB7_SULAD|nr:putative 3-oxoacyl-ACP reductase [Sulfobacillus acidophilus TPY]AEW05529.1 3-oxoacyl-(acyl-carrier-protein) reductase [Sulfobacillus acidophilus DSM 10332]
MYPELTDRTAVVTGAGRGIGRAEALRLASEGARLAVVDLRQEDAENTVNEIRSGGGRAEAYGVDVVDADAVRAMMEDAARRLGPIAILVNNAGITRDNLLFKMSVEDWDAVLDTHLKGSFLCAREAQRYMVEQKWGKIVNTSSTSALGNRGQANYSAAKAGLQGLTRTLAIELGPFNINVNAVAPGFIDTDMTRDTARRLGLDAEQFKAGAAARIPLRRVGVPDDIANVVAFLCSDQSSYISGQVIYVRGGPAE